MSQVSVNGVRLGVDVHGDGPTILLLHGFAGSSSMWKPFRNAWTHLGTVAVDLPGHGASDSPADPRRYSFDNEVADLLAVMDELGRRRFAVLGYSMGGRVALHLALHLAESDPQRLTTLVLESASPGITDQGERALRRQADAALAANIESKGIEWFVGQWERLPLFATQDRLPAAARAALRAERLRNDSRGLANTLRAIGAGEQQPLLSRLRELNVPALLLAGALDPKYREIATQMANVLPNASVETVAGAGHTVHLEQPARFARVVSDFLGAPSTLPDSARTSA